MELHEALVAAELTTLQLAREDASRPGSPLRLRLARRWDPSLDWSTYGRAFQADGVPCRHPAVLGDDDARARLDRLGAGPALAAAEDLMRRGGHEEIVLDVHAGLGVRACQHVHASRMGANNGHHALRAGGIRRHEPDEPEADVLLDGLNLARGMSFKNAAARIPFGGCKMTVQCAPFALDDLPRLGFVARCIDAGLFFTGPDMGFSPGLADALRARYTRNIVGGTAGTMGPTGTPTARGTFLAMGECAAFRFGGDGASALAGRRGAVQGLGAVGLPLARLMHAAGMALVVADPDPERVRAARSELSGLETVPPEEILAVDCDVLAPCAIGGVLDRPAIAALRCEILCGPANNQLRAASRDEEEELARALRDRDVLYVPEWSHNIAGVVAGMEEYLHQEDARMERIEPHLERVCRDGTRDLLHRARDSGRTPTELLYADLEDRIAGRPGAGPAHSSST